MLWRQHNFGVSDLRKGPFSIVFFLLDLFLSEATTKGKKSFRILPRLQKWFCFFSVEIHPRYYTLHTSIPPRSAWYMQCIVPGLHCDTKNVRKFLPVLNLRSHTARTRMQTHNDRALNMLSVTKELKSTGVFQRKKKYYFQIVWVKG